MKCPYQMQRVIHKSRFDDKEGYVEKETTTFYDCIYIECPFYYPSYLRGNIEHHCLKAEKEVK